MKAFGLIPAALIVLTGCNTVLRPNLAPVPAAESAPASPQTGQKLARQPAKPSPQPVSQLIKQNPAATADASLKTAPAEPAGQAKPQPPKLIWTRIRKGFRLPDRNHKRVSNDLNWFKRHPEYLQRVMKRAEPFLYMIVAEIERRKMPMEIALLPAVESAFQPFAYSHGRAAGIWQFIPGTGRLYGLKQNWWYDGRRDVMASTRAALDMLQDLHRRFGGNWLHALAAYNSGPGTVAKAIRRNKKRGKPTSFWHLKLPKETRGYVPKLLALSELVANPDKHGIRLYPLANRQQVIAVNVGSQIDLAQAAWLSDISIEEIYRLNPAFNRWATDPRGPHKLLIPVEKLTIFHERFRKLPASQRVQWKRHRIDHGETLITIAKKYRTSVALLKQVNRIHGNSIRANRHIIIPVARLSLQQYSLTSRQRLKSLQARKRTDKGYKSYYTVRMGDNLWDISRKHRIGVRRLAKWNGMAPRDRLRVGQKLVIWTKKPQPRVSTSTPVRNIPVAVIRPITYVVRNGDSLARIAWKFKVSISQLKKWNKSVLTKRKYLKPGQRLRVYVDITRQAGNA